jgi:hypothetical protein
MRLEENPQLPLQPDSHYAGNLNFTLSRLFRNIAQKVNAIGDGRLNGSDLVAATVPTTGTYAQGDFIRNSAPVEAGAASSKYVVLGWICTVGGTPGTLLQCRVLTGN